MMLLRATTKGIGPYYAKLLWFDTDWKLRVCLGPRFATEAEAMAEATRIKSLVEAHLDNVLEQEWPMPTK
jgi:hypothetical protein